MHLLYIDESGAVDDASQEYFILAGVSVFERKTHWIEAQLNQIASRFNPDDARSVELHGSPMRGRKGFWKNFPLAERLDAIKMALQQAIASQPRKSVRLFGAVIKKNSLNGEDTVVHAFE